MKSENGLPVTICWSARCVSVAEAKRSSGSARQRRRNIPSSSERGSPARSSAEGVSSEGLRPVMSSMRIAPSE